MSILLTGATGFVGGAIAANLAAKGLLADTRFAVRGDTPAEGLARLRSNLRRFELGAGTLDAITESQIVPFDLRDAGAARLGDPEIIINCAALATFSNHPSLWETNVGGVLALGKLAAQGSRLKRFVQIGTAMSCGQLGDRHVSESWEVPPIEQHAVP